MTTLTGQTPLWDSLEKYVHFIGEHRDEILRHSDDGDENAAFIVDLLIYGIDTPERRVVLKVITERYIHDYHPDIATIEGGYPRDADSPAPPDDAKGGA